jgi:hypothetical protein
MPLFLAVIVILVIFGIGPLLTIWSLNTLFALGIAYSFKTWCATVLLQALIMARVKVDK